jgi:hypothetical protein
MQLYRCEIGLDQCRLEAPYREAGISPTWGSIAFLSARVAITPVLFRSRIQLRML